MERVELLADSGDLAAAERRKERRKAASGIVRVYPDDSSPAQVEGRLMDYSKDGFRMAHQQGVFRAGKEVRFRHFRAQGRAVAVWNRATPDHAETGFLVLKNQR